MYFMRIIFHGSCHAFFNMALDEAISEAVRKGISPPTLRLYQWSSPSISIGYFQRASDINIEYCNKKGYPVVRRPTGGRAILHGSELTYSLSARTGHHLFKGRLLEDYAIISKAIALGLTLNGINAQISFSRRRRTRQKSPVCFKSISYGEITVDNKKIVGSAQKRYSDGFLQQGSIPFSLDLEELRRVLAYREENFHDMGAILDYSPQITINKLKNSLKEAFERVLNVKMISDRPTEFELRLAKELEEKKYSTPDWNYSR